MANYRDYILSFLFGGILVSGIRFLANTVDPMYAAIIAAFPIGLISSYFIMTHALLKEYVTAYIKNIVILFVVALVFYQLLNLNYSSNTSLAITLVIWLVLNIALLYLRHIFQ